MYIDTHCHINSEELRLDARGVIARAHNAGVGRMVIVGCTYDDSCEAVAMAENFSQFGLYASVGIHPHEAKNYDEVPAEFAILVNNPKVVAVGEIGLDYHYDNSPRDVQRKMFEAQLNFAHEHDMPVILHIRDAMPDAMAILSHHSDLKLLFHCYSGGLEWLDSVIAMDAMCAFGGAVTWNGKGGEDLREVVRQIPINHMLIETDSPYMSPAPFRGKLNEPANVTYVYEAIARERGMLLHDLQVRVDSNAESFFEWSMSNV